MNKSPDALILFSGGLDSLLAARLLMEQGLYVRCLHFYSPFFGNPAKTDHWRSVYGLDILPIDASEPFVSMLAASPKHGTGKILNPCIDCKITLLKMASHIMAETGAKFLATGEVLGQRPMSQRQEALNIIAKESHVTDFLLRPLSARLLPLTHVEESGLVDRGKLLGINGRGRKPQLELARNFGISEIPTPAGGCRLTERENARRYWALLRRFRKSDSSISELIRDLELANIGRVLFYRDGLHWLCVGKNESENKKLREKASAADRLLTLSLPGPTAILRGPECSGEILVQAGEILASYAPRAIQAGSVEVKVRSGDQSRTYIVSPARNSYSWTLPEWEETRSQIRSARKEST